MIKINDVYGRSQEGTGRVIDLNRRSADYFGRGLIPGTKITPIRGYRGATGPITAQQAAALRGEHPPAPSTTPRPSTTPPNVSTSEPYDLTPGGGGPRAPGDIRGSEAQGGTLMVSPHMQAAHDELDQLHAHHEHVRRRMQHPIKMHVDAPRLRPSGDHHRQAARSIRKRDADFHDRERDHVQLTDIPN